MLPRLNTTETIAFSLGIVYPIVRQFFWHPLKAATIIRIPILILVVGIVLALRDGGWRSDAGATLFA